MDRMSLLNRVVARSPLHMARVAGHKGETRFQTSAFQRASVCGQHQPVDNNCAISYRKAAVTTSQM